MALSEQRRHRMYRQLEELLGEEAAGTLIEHLPRATWADLPTKAELIATKKDLEARMESLEQRLLDRVERSLAEKLNQQTRAIVLFMAALFVSVATLAFTAFKLA